MRTYALAPLALVILLSGCSAPAPTVSQECGASLEAMATAPDDVTSEVWNGLIDESTRACPTVAEYIAGVEQYPESWWHSESPINFDIVIVGACLLDATTPMCVDAAAHGYDVG